MRSKVVWKLARCMGLASFLTTLGHGAITTAQANYCTSCSSYCTENNGLFKCWAVCVGSDMGGKYCTTPGGTCMLSGQC